MSTIKITQLPLITQLNANTSNTTFVAVDNEAGITGRFTGTTLAAGLYANNVLNVGNNVVTLPNTIAQFSLRGESYVQTNFVNLSDGGSADHVITANTGTDTTYFVDMGFANRYFNPGTEYNSLGTAIEPLSGYLYVQGNTSGSIGGNLIIGTTSSNTETRFIAGGGTSANVIAKITPDGLKLVNGKTIIFDDGSIQNTAAATLAYTEAAFSLANTNTNNITTIVGVNTTQNTSLVAINSYAQTAFALANTNENNIVSAWNTANNALANTSGTFNGNLNVDGNITIKGVGGIYQDTASPSIMVANTSANFQIESRIRNKIWSFSEYGTLTTPGNVSVNGTLVLANSNFSPTESAMTITATANVVTPSNDGYMLHISGKQNTASRIVIDSFSVTGNAYGLLAGRTARGTVDAPLAAANGDILMRISGNGYGTTGFAPLGIARIDIVATENYTDSARGSQIQFWNVPTGSNTLQQIASFNGDSVHFTGQVTPAKGFVYTPRILAGSQTAITIAYTNDSLIKANLVADLTISHSNFVAGKVVDMWLTNASGSPRTITHGVSSINSTKNSTTFTMPASSSAYLKFFSVSNDLANTFVSVTHA